MNRAHPTAPILLALLAVIGHSGNGAEEIPQFAARGGAFHLARDGQDTPLFVHAANRAVGVPGTQPGALAATEAQYANWPRQIGGMGFRAVRIYTLHYPRFYQASHHYYPKPLFVAQFGVPTSWGDAHIAFFSGMDHGGHDEETQGRYAVRIFHNLAQAGCAGGALLEWIDIGQGAPAVVAVSPSGNLFFRVAR